MITSTIVLAMVMGLGGLVSIMMGQQVDASNGSNENCVPSYPEVALHLHPQILTVMMYRTRILKLNEMIRMDSTEIVMD